MTGPGRRYDLRAISDGLANQIESLCQELLPAGKRDGAEWRCGSVAGEPGKSLAVHLRPPRAGVWCDFSSADPRHRGDALALVAAVLFGGNVGQAIRWARGWLGLDTGFDHNMMETRQAARPVTRPAERDDDGRRVSAQKLWLSAESSIIGTPVDAYFEARGISLAHLGRIPRALRFHPEVWCAEAQRRMPALVTAISGADGDHVATHRTYLARDAEGVWRKARLVAPKKVLGGYVGGSIRLWRGMSKRPLANAPATDTVAIVEGIEDGLTVAMASPEWRVISAISVSNFANIELPPQILEVVLVCDRDTGKGLEMAEAARAKAVERWRGERRRVLRSTPPEGFKDFNDWWQAGLPDRAELVGAA